jgi:preprotein translocase subunit SecG
MFTSLLPYLQIAFSVILIVLVLLQKSGVSAGGALGGQDNWSAPFHTRRGVEKWLFNATITISVLFAVSAFVAIILK